MSNIARERFEATITDTSDIYIGAGWDREEYLQGLEHGLREAMCEPFNISAIVAEPGFPEAAVGTAIHGTCIARAGGYWLVYQEEADRFLCFWGETPELLSAPGIFGSPLGCWAA